MATAWQRTYESLDDLTRDVVVEEREAERRAEVLERLGFENHEGPFVRTRAKPEQLRVALAAAMLILDSGVIPAADPRALARVRWSGEPDGQHHGDSAAAVTDPLFGGLPRGRVRNS
jgi:hypothetical protein